MANNKFKRKTKDLDEINVKPKSTKEKAYDDMFKKSSTEPEEVKKENKSKKKGSEKIDKEVKTKMGYYLKESTIKAVKRASIDTGDNYSEIVEKALEKYLDKKYFID